MPSFPLYKVGNWNLGKLESKITHIVGVEQNSNSDLSESQHRCEFFLRGEKKSLQILSYSCKTNYIWDLGKPVIQPEETTVPFK